MNPKLSIDVVEFVTSAPNGVVRIEDVTGGVYWVMTDETMRVRQYVQEGIDQADRGEVAPWNSDDIKAAGRRLKQERSG